jgi:hypothetical protein
MHRIMFITTYHAIIRVSHATKSAFVSNPTTFVKSTATVRPTASNDFRAVDAKPSATPNCVLATWRFVNVIQISVKHVEPVSVVSEHK